MGKMKELYLEQLEQATPDEGDLYYGDKVRVVSGFYRGVTGVVYQHLVGTHLGPESYMIAIPDVADKDGIKGILCYRTELEALS